MGTALLEELDALRLPPEAPGYLVESLGGSEALFERRREMLDPDARVFIARMTTDVPSSVASALMKVGLAEQIGAGTPVAIKVNIGGGVAGVPSSFTDPLVSRASSTRSARPGAARSSARRTCGR